MPRPFRQRRIGFAGNFFNFVPRGIANFEEIILAVDEAEAIRLIDLEEMEQSKAAKKMKISQPTLSRILKSARNKMADAIINGKSIKIQGGVYKMVQPRGMGMRRMARAGGRGRMGGPVAGGPGGMCRCPKCGTEVQHQIGVPCAQQKCPKCGSPMTRG